jgi:hypothetical protein
MANHTLLPERPPTFRWWAIRLGSLIVAAIALVVLAGVIGYAIESRTLATRMIRTHGGDQVAFRIHREGDDISVSVRQIRSGSGTGWSKTMSLGTTKSLGGTEASIDLDESGERVLLRVGNRDFIFDLRSKQFDFPADGRP